jgi:gliding motility-associated-like protein
MKKIFIYIFLTSWFSNYFGQITTSINPTIAQMQALLQGNGVVVSGLTITCPAGAYATFNNGAAALGGLNTGILLTTGTASNVAGPTPNTTANNLSYPTFPVVAGPGSALGNTLSGGTTYDGCFINFLITPSCATLSINYVFASEEYPEYSAGTINDVFGFVISGPNPAGGNYNQTNISVLPGTSTPVSIQNVNNGTNNNGPCVNCGYYVHAPGGLEYDARTTVLTASTTVTPCQTYTMTIGVWDDSDEIIDSGVFLDVNGLSCANQPSLTATVSPTSICGPQTVTLSVAGGFAIGTYTWSAPASGGLVSTSGATVTANPTAATTYTVRYSDINTCPGFPVTQTVAISFSTTPSFPVTQSPAGSLCTGESATLTASGGTGTYSWTPGTGLSSSTGSVVVTTPTATTTYTVTKTNGACSSFSVITVNVNPAGSVAITPSLSTICAGQSVALTSGGAGPFVWTASSGATPPSVATVTVSPTTTTTYTVLVGSGTCTSSAVATVSVSTTPAIAITPSLSTICLGQSVALTSSGAGPFVWTASSGTTPPAVANVTVTPTTTTTYTVLSGTGTCTATAVATVSISTVPSISITPSLSTICSGQSVVLTSSGAGPFVWTASSGANPAAVGTVTVSPTVSTTYTVLSGTGACTATAVAGVSVAPVAPIAITPSLSTICVGQTVTLNSSGTGPFVWTASSGATPPAASSVTVSPTTTTTFTVLSGTGTCTTSAVATVSVSTTSSISIISSGTVLCSGQSATLTVVGNAGPFVWTASTGTNPAPNGTVTVNPNSTTTYSVLAGAGTCTANAVATVSVLPVINPLIIATSPSVCLTKTVTLNAAAGTGLTYTWQPTVAISGANNNSSVSAVPQTTATVIYTVTVSNGVCSSSDTIQIKVLVAPDIKNVTTLNNDTICVGGCVTFSANTTGSAPIFYQWYYQSGVGTSSVGVAPEACYPSAGNFSVVATASNTCGVDTLIKTNFVTVFDLPVLVVGGDTTINIGESATVYASGGLSYSWSPNLNGSIACPTCSSTVVQPTLTTQYIVVASNSIYCKVQDTVTVIVDINCGDFFIPNVFSPNGDGLNDLINVHGRCISTFNLQIFNRWGEKVFETSSLSESWDGTFRGQKLDTGVFIYKADGVSIDGQEFKMKGNITLLR